MDDELSKIINLLIDNQLTSISVKHGNDEIRVSKTAQPAALIPASPVQKADSADTTNTIKAPGVGTFYTSPNPEAEPFVTVGDLVTPETTVGIVEAMKMMTEIKAGLSGTIQEVFVANGDNIEYGQKLFRIG
ncbi:acetyl-CoA carboxylase biotin carboxyl carrier protein [Fructobacillus ficulneus]|uniref:Biotin carboxyl carrier protein of acetyl-CoA carboxylase n=1 Tax=Fructobacillus ficulneus TaxID=157463 RepID=A0A0K8MII4_9LACO|nr:biotin/lipoyl-containing protein [Fructobacillus ficulneus]GAP00371.1 hypothetical protein FFIC_283880 [Fructobacillus ficulneus]